MQTAPYASVHGTHTIGFIADYAFLGLPSGVNWRMMLGLGVIMPTILIVLTLTFMPETPRWLLMKGRRDEAIAVLKRTYPRTTDCERMAAEIEGTIHADFEANHAGTWHAILCPSPVVVRMLLAGVGLAACQQLNGSESLGESWERKGDNWRGGSKQSNRHRNPPPYKPQSTSRPKSCTELASSHAPPPSA